MPSSDFLKDFNLTQKQLDDFKKYDIVFLDPPYQKGLLLPALKSVLPLMSDYGMIVCEYPPEVNIPEEIGGFSVYRTYRYGKINVAIYRKGL